MLLLDTCVLLWLVGDQTKLSQRAKKEISKNPGRLFISAISAFEIGIKCRNGKLELPLNPADWYEEALAFHGINEIPVSGSIALHSVELPPIHNDPCDRIIIGTAVEHKMKIITSDSIMANYTEAKIVW